ncbi:fibrobacter succinogenes major paralogous domain-containing protein [Fibrobacter sp.]|uniref:fibrobacter succinogenes major paralogous domain-containing protein n=1 Tax=Fibrobacter sp. TaxID=35828 RepID=UPI0025C2EE58|nr:fibrobacter succinogenes major paralogous domain-containing protein [Fibrobacter sp.]MBR3072686.1 fibrobacter succinogenes major paralogous domain-containing protein [Fibrobacter sp.]
MSINHLSWMLFVGFFYSACTDYVAQIEDKIEERERTSIINQSSDDSRDTDVIGSMTDSRDGQKYKTVKIGEQIWMAENLNYETANSYCYNDNASYCSKYGRLYTWAAAMDSVGTWSKNGKGCGYGTTCSPTYPVRGICPEGWHLPTEAEFETLFTAVGGKSTAGKVLKSTTGWTTYSGITNEEAFAFSALPAGGRYSNGSFSYEGDVANFWSSTEYNSFNAYYMYLYYDYDGADLYGSVKYYGFSVRCLKD